jgi:hypothetical protein
MYFPLDDDCLSSKILETPYKGSGPSISYGSEFFSFLFEFKEDRDFKIEHKQGRSVEIGT